MMHLAAIVALLGLAACAERTPGPTASERDAVESSVRVPADSLAVEIAGGGIWYTLARDARAGDGQACVERTLEVRRGADRVAVPLLYTLDIPTVLDDTAATARVYRDCSPGDRYRFNLRTGQPVRVP